MAEVVARMKKMSLTTQIMIATLLGLIFGGIAGPVISDVRVVGDVWIRLVQMVVPVLILGAVTEALGSLKPGSFGKLGFQMGAWFVATTTIAAIVSIIFSTSLGIGTGIEIGVMETDIVPPPPQTPVQVILGFFGTNIIASMAAGNMIHIIIFAIFLGLSISAWTETSGDDTVISLVSKLNKCIMGIIKMIMKAAPIGIFGMMSWVSGYLGFAVILPLLQYLGSLALSLIVYFAAWTSFTSLRVGVNPIKMARKCMDMIIVAATTTSGAVALPVKMQDCVEKIGISKRISDVVNPLGTTLNSDGAVMFTTHATVLLLNVFGMDFGLTELIQIIVVCVLATFGTLAVPGGALVIYAGLMPQFGLPMEGLALIAGVDWFRGMLTTPANVVGDAYVAANIAKREKEFYHEVFNGTMTASEAAEKYAVTGGKIA